MRSASQCNPFSVLPALAFCRTRRLVLLQLDMRRCSVLTEFNHSAIGVMDLWTYSFPHILRVWPAPPLLVIRHTACGYGCDTTSRLRGVVIVTCLGFRLSLRAHYVFPIDASCQSHAATTMAVCTQQYMGIRLFRTTDGSQALRAKRPDDVATHFCPRWVRTSSTAQVYK